MRRRLDRPLRPTPPRPHLCEIRCSPFAPLGLLVL